MPTRVPSDNEWGQLSAVFPGLNRANVFITDEPTPVYNCIAFSLGLTNVWINPPQPLSAFQALYNNPPYNHPTLPAASGSASIDGWATPAVGPTITQMTHGSRTSAAKPGLWESKLGQWFRITHGRAELTGTSYGRIVTSFG